jgi:VNT family MFS transporter (synaptic vesicle glycoprotein 2)
LESKDKLCNDKIESDVFMESLITVAAAFPSNVLAVLFMDRLGRKCFLGKYNKLYKLSNS